MNGARLYQLDSNTLTLIFFDVLPDKDGTLYPVPPIGASIIALIHDKYYHCNVYEETDSYEEGGQTHTVIYTVDDDFVEFSEIKKWAYLKG